MIRRAVVGWSALLSLTACASPGADPDEAAPLVIVNAMIIDGRGNPPVEDGVVVVVGDRIEAAGVSGAVQVPEGAVMIDAGGGAVIPGLADMHVHLVGGWDGESPDMLGFRRYLNALLYSGVTSVLDVGNVLPYIQQIRAEVDAGRIEGPRIHMVGPLIDGPRPIWPPLSYPSVDAAVLRRSVGQLADAGVDALKGYVGLDESMVDSLVTMAAEHALPVIVDLGPTSAVASAVRSGVDALAHAPSGDWSEADIVNMLERATASISTLAVFESFAGRRLADPSFLEHPLIAATSPPWFLDDLRARVARPLSSDQQAMAERMGERLAAAMVNIKNMHDSGVLIVAGTDAPYPGVFQGEGIHRELELLVEAGLSPLDAIATATHNAATLLGAGGEWGAVEPGMRADLVVLRGNPALEITATREVAQVIQGGRVLDRDALAFDPETDPGFRTVGTVAGN